MSMEREQSVIEAVIEAVEQMLGIDKDDIVARVNPSQFAALKAEVNAILKAIVANPPKDRYCVNYADLRCVGVSRVIEDDGGQWWLVEMEEGDDHEFCQMVREQLSDKWGSVIVRMEW